MPFLEARLQFNDASVLIDCESAGGFDKSQVSLGFSAEEAVKNVAILAGGVSNQLAELVAAAPNDAQVELEFGVKVDANAVVAIARSPQEGQFRVRITWKG